MKPIKKKDAIKLLRANGWSIKRNAGPHELWASPNGAQTLAVPRHGECSVGIVRQIATFMDIPDNWK